MPSQTSSRRVDRRTRRARRERTDARTALLAAALELVAERGYDGCSVDDIAQRAGYSKGAVYWHFASKDELFFALLDEAVDRPWREVIELLQSASPEHDMGAEASERFAEMVAGQRSLLLVQQEYLSRALRDPKLRPRYAKRQRLLQDALANAVSARLQQLQAPAPPQACRAMASAMIALVAGLAQAKLIDPAFAPQTLLGDTFALLYTGHAARSGQTAGLGGGRRGGAAKRP